jgi:hypothetical protein
LPDRRVADGCDACVINAEWSLVERGGPARTFAVRADRRTVAMNMLPLSGAPLFTDGSL